MYGITKCNIITMVTHAALKIKNKKTRMLSHLFSGDELRCLSRDLSLDFLSRDLSRCLSLSLDLSWALSLDLSRTLGLSFSLSLSLDRSLCLSCDLSLDFSFDLSLKASSGSSLVFFVLQLSLPSSSSSPF